MGPLLVTVIAGVMYVGFFASNSVLAGKSLHGIEMVFRFLWAS